MKQVFKKVSSALITAVVIGTTVNAYDIVERATLADDRYKTLELSRDLGHDFFIDFKGYVSGEAMDLGDDAKKISDVDTTNSTAAIAEINTLLGKYYDKEQIIRANFGLGFPLFSFNAYGTKFKPNFRVEGGLFAMLTPRKDLISMTTVISNLDQIPAAYRTALTSCLTAESPWTDGENILDTCSPTYISNTQVAFIKETYGITNLPYQNALNTAIEAPSIDIYAKVEAKAGLFFDYKRGKHWFGKIGLYGLGRTDIKKKANAVLLLGGGSELDYADNTLINLALDYRLGYKNSNYSVFAALEEVKLMEMSKSDEGDLNFGSDMIARLHAQADYNVSIFKMSPYFGLHARSAYSIMDSYYFGADWGMFTWEDRLGLNLKTQIDKEHFTLGARAKIWIMHADLTAKLPLGGDVDGIKPTANYGANIRFFF